MQYRDQCSYGRPHSTGTRGQTYVPTALHPTTTALRPAHPLTPSKRAGSIQAVDQRIFVCVNGHPAVADEDTNADLGAIGDLDGEELREDMLVARQTGYTDYVDLHPNHVEHANEIFTRISGRSSTGRASRRRKSGASTRYSTSVR